MDKFVPRTLRSPHQVPHDTSPHAGVNQSLVNQSHLATSPITAGSSFLTDPIPSTPLLPSSFPPSDSSDDPIAIASSPLSERRLRRSPRSEGKAPIVGDVLHAPRGYEIRGRWRQKRLRS